MEVFNAAFDFKFEAFLDEETIEVSKKDCKKYCKVSLKSPRRFLENMITSKYGHRVTNSIVPKIRKHFPRQQMFYYTVTDDPEDDESIIYQYYKGNIDLRQFNNKRIRGEKFKGKDFKLVRKLRVDELKRSVVKLEAIEDEEYPWAIFCRVISRRSPVIYPNKEEFEVMLENINIYSGWVRKALERAKSELDDDDSGDSEEEESREEERIEVGVENYIDPPWFNPDDIFSVSRFLDEYGPTISYAAFERICAAHAVNAQLREALVTMISEENTEFFLDHIDNVTSNYDPGFMSDSDEDF